MYFGAEHLIGFLMFVPSAQWYSYLGWDDNNKTLLNTSESSISRLRRLFFLLHPHSPTPSCGPCFTAFSPLHKNNITGVAVKRQVPLSSPINMDVIHSSGARAREAAAGAGGDSASRRLRQRDRPQGAGWCSGSAPAATRHTPASVPLPYLWNTPTGCA